MAKVDDKFKVGDKVKIPFNSTGTVVKVEDHLLWGFRYIVKIRKANPVFYIRNTKEEFKEEQLELEPIN